MEYLRLHSQLSQSWNRSGWKSPLGSAHPPFPDFPASSTTTDTPHAKAFPKIPSQPLWDGPKAVLVDPGCDPWEFLSREYSLGLLVAEARVLRVDVGVGARGRLESHGTDGTFMENLAVGTLDVGFDGIDAAEHHGAAGTPGEFQQGSGSQPARGNSSRDQDPSQRWRSRRSRRAVPVPHPAGEVQAGVLEVRLEVGQQEVAAALGAHVGRAAAVHALVRAEAAAVGQDHGARRAHLQNRDSPTERRERRPRAAQERGGGFRAPSDRKSVV